MTQAKFRAGSIFKQIIDRIKVIENTDSGLAQQLNDLSISLTQAIQQKANVQHTHNISDINQLQSTLDNLTNLINNIPSSQAMNQAMSAKADKVDLDKKPFVYVNGMQQNNPKIWIGTAVVSGGNAVFYLTDTGTSMGSAIFTSSTIFVQPILFAANAPPAFAPFTLSANRKTLTIPVSKATTGVQLLSVNLLGANAPANGDTVTIWVIGT